jgi:molecular chaperone DnaK
MSLAIGIDLGTTNSVVAISEGGVPRVLADESGATLLPSVVSFHPDGRVLVGRDARRRRVIDARNTIHSTKRLIGRRWGTPEVERARKISSFELVEGDKRSIEVVSRGSRFPLPAISALVLERAKQIAERALGRTVTQAVVTVPASFNDLQRTATRRAAQEAGLEVLRVLNEPTAAALAYGLGSTEAERLAVYDLGGGTFDLTLLEVESNVIEVVATAGDSFLGGDDIDLAIARQVALAVLRETGIDSTDNPTGLALLRAAAEHLKVLLSTQETAEVELRAIGYREGGAAIDYKFGLSRAELETIAQPYVDRTLAICDDALRQSRLEIGSFESVILVGGSTRMPYVQERVEAFFGKRPRVEWNPDEVVALGAAIMASMLADDAVGTSGPVVTKPAAVPADLLALSATAPVVAMPPPMMVGGDGQPPPPAPAQNYAPPPPQAQPRPAPPAPPPRPPNPAPQRAPQLPVPAEPPRVPSVLPTAGLGAGPLLIDVTPLTLSVQIVGGLSDAIIARNTPVPCTRTRRYTTGVDSQKEIFFRVVQGEGAVASQNTLLGELVLSELPPARRGDLWIEVTFELDADGILIVHARDEGSGRAVSAQMRVTPEG